MDFNREIYLCDILDLLDFEVLSLYYKGSWIGDFKNTYEDKTHIKKSCYIKDRVSCISYDDSSPKIGNIEIFLTEKIKQKSV